MKKLSPISGKELTKILCNRFGFRVIRQKGSHATLTNGTIYVTVPQKEIRVGLLGVILRDWYYKRRVFERSLARTV